MVSGPQLAAKAQEIREYLALAAPVRDAQGDLPLHDQGVVALLADTLCRLDSIRAWVEEHGIEQGRGLHNNVLHHEDRLQNRALKLMAELGMTPRSRAALGLDLLKGVSLAEAMSEQDADKRADLIRRATGGE